MGTAGKFAQTERAATREEEEEEEEEEEGRRDGRAEE